MSARKVTILEYKNEFDRNFLGKGNRYENAFFIKFLMEQDERKLSGKEISELTGLKSFQVSDYKQVIRLGRTNDLKTKTVMKILKEAKQEK